MLDQFLPARLPLPSPVRDGLEAAAADFLAPDSGMAVDFAAPAGEPALLAPDSLSWRVFKNPVSLFIGGVAAVILELAEPRVRTGVWEHTAFRDNPALRIRRTGLAAMATIYAARSVAEAMIARVRRAHERVAGFTPAGQAYRANDPDLLEWVQATATFGFSEAYGRFVRRLTARDHDRLYAEGAPAARLYGVARPPAARSDVRALMERTLPSLERSPIVFEFIEILRATPLFPPALAPMQRMLIRAAVEIVPGRVRQVLGLGRGFGLRPFERTAVASAAALADRVLLRNAPPAEACVRLGLAPDYLFRS